ncbi:stage IV sporulation protein FB [Caldalkalibacillus thermarum]|uniref:M50 family metallopeptidase n=1 Tax=Caldalkalibacillus thermarum TaxID=296745 RepID=UPI00166A8A5F|nr:M50 family metallopeptidase [Caldalkalibacillus thermarum]GGK16004.1 stage IV sporulation protein FB [Caldalkalibacillus thermarum]
MSKVAVHPVFYVLILFALLHGFIYDLLLLFMIVIIHELGHVCTALSLGWRLKKVELLPFGGVVEVEEHGNKSPREECWVIVAGPLTNVIMIIVAWLFLKLELWSPAFSYVFIEYNLVILIFNLLPMWPLDGGKLLQLGFSLVLPYKKAIQHSLLVSGGCFVFYVLGVIFFFPYYFSLWVMAVFLFISQWMEWKQAPYQFMRFLLERQKQHQRDELNDLDVLSVALSPQHSINEALEHMFRHKRHYFCLITPGGKVENVLSEQELLHCFFNGYGGHRAVGDVFR